MKNILVALATILMLLSDLLLAQKPVFVANGNYKYIIGDFEPPSDWNQPEFDDSGWLIGRKGIGFGDNDDTTVTKKATSLYLRINFYVAEKDTFKMANFFVDFDDGFVAYLNGKEILRANLGRPGNYISHDMPATSSHEAILYRRFYNPNGFYLDSTVLWSNINEGGNYLCVQVHNDSINGSDLTFNSYLFNLTGFINNIYRQFFDKKVPVAFNRYFRKTEILPTKFPIVVINTDEFGISANNTRYKAWMGIIENKDDLLNEISGKYTGYDGQISISIRGNNAADHIKKSYRIETQDSLGENLNVPLLGMPKENDWILYAPLLDKSLIRNELAFTIGRKQGHYQPRTRYCELILNGEYQGLYVLMEKIKRDKNRIDISKLEPKDKSGLALTGGYILQYGYADYSNIEYPKPKEITAEQAGYIKNYLKTYYDVLNSDNFLDPLTGYKQYIDEHVLIDYIIANELFKNCDSYSGSTYLYKNNDAIDGRLKFGPLWDNDLAFGDAPNSWQQASRTDGWQFLVKKGLQITKIMRDTSFVNGFKSKWKNLRQYGFLRTDSIESMIDSLINYVGDARDRNFDVWPVLDKDLYFNYWGEPNVCVSQTYEGAILNLKMWIKNRTEWIDNNIDLIYYPVTANMNEVNIIKTGNLIISPNPMIDHLDISCNLEKSGTYILKITSINGNELIQWKLNFKNGLNTCHLADRKINEMAKGIYLLSIWDNAKILNKSKIVKL